MTAEEMIKELSKLDPGRHVYYISRDEEPSRTDRIPKWSNALEHVQECGRAAIRGENTAVGDDPEHTEELEQQFQAAQELAGAVESNVKQVIVFLEGRNSAANATTG